jgi:hypothetical protein
MERGAVDDRGRQLVANDNAKGGMVNEVHMRALHAERGITGFLERRHDIGAELSLRSGDEDLHGAASSSS